MRVGLVCPYDIGSPGGVQELVADLAGQLRAAGDEVILVGAGNEERSGDPGSDVATVPAGRPLSVRGNKSRVPLTLSPSAWWKVRSALRDVDVVHVHEPFIPLVGWAALTVDKPMVITFHADAPGWARVLYRLIPLGRRMQKARLTAVSPTASRAIPGRWGEVRVVPNAIDAPSFDVPVARVARRVAFLGRDDPRKGLDVLIEAWPRILEAQPDAELVVMGADRGVPPPGVTYLGPVSADEKRQILASSSVYVAPNTGGESFGLVVAEAMAAGCAVVASDLEAFRAVVNDAARLFPVGDPAALAEQVVRLLANPDQARRLGEVAREHVKRYDWGEVARAYRGAYAEALR